MKCKICNKQTEVVYIINTYEIPVCENCSSEIFIQQARKYAEKGSIFNKPKTIVSKPKKHPEKVVEILNYLYGDLLGKGKKYTLNSIPKAYLDIISNRLNDGYSVEQCKAVCYTKWREWKNDPDTLKFVRASTLFRPKNFPIYLAEVPENWNPENTKEQRDIINKLNTYGIRGIKNNETDKLAKQLIDTGYNRKDFLNLYLKEKI